MLLRWSRGDDFITKISSDDALFHYTKRSTVFEKILDENRFLLSNFKNTNDPFEYKRRLIRAVGWGWDKQSPEAVFETEYIAASLIRERTHFASFCMNRFEDGSVNSYGFLKSRMWSQYGENHEGLCLVFSKKRTIDAMNKIINPTCLFFHDEVEYHEYVRDSVHDTLYVNADSLVEKTPHEVAIDYIKKCYKDLLFIKQNDYRDEDEYRFVICDTNELSTEKSMFEFDAKECLIGMIAGDRFHKAYNPLMQNAMENLRIDCRKLHWEHGEYHLLSNKCFSS